jgi:hypothetical protein
MFNYEIGQKTEQADQQERQVPGIIVGRLNLEEAGCHLLEISADREKG